MIRLLQTNSRITKLDLTENRIPINTLQMILRILKRRREMTENITSKKRFRIDMRRDLINNRIHELIKQRRRSLRNRAVSCRFSLLCNLNKAQIYLYI